MAALYAGRRQDPSTNFAVLLSGGRSQRMGLPKALLEARRGMSFADLLARSCRRAGLMPLLVVRAHSPLGAMHPRLEVVENGAWVTGQLGSIRTGVRAALLRGAKRILIHPIDAPLVKPETLAEVLGALDSAAVVVPTSFGQRGHPVGLTAEAAGSVVLKTVLPSLQLALSVAKVHELIVRDPHLFDNINTQADYLRLFGRAPRLVSRAAQALAKDPRLARRW